MFSGIPELETVLWLFPRFTPVNGGMTVGFNAQTNSKEPFDFRGFLAGPGLAVGFGTSAFVASGK